MTITQQQHLWTRRERHDKQLFKINAIQFQLFKTFDFFSTSNIFLFFNIWTCLTLITVGTYLYILNTSRYSCYTVFWYMLIWWKSNCIFTVHNSGPKLWNCWLCLYLLMYKTTLMQLIGQHLTTQKWKWMEYNLKGGVSSPFLSPFHDKPKGTGQFIVTALINILEWLSL